MIRTLSLLVAKLRAYARMILFAYFCGYRLFTYYCGYLILYQLMLRCWDELCYDSWNGGSGSSVYS